MFMFRYLKAVSRFTVGNSADQILVGFTDVQVRVFLASSLFQFVDHGLAGHSSLPNTGCVIFQLHIIQTFE